MRLAVSLGLLMICAAPGLAADLGGTPGAPGKTDAHAPAHPVFDREGGETLATAVPIPSLPYSDSGATCDNVDDYDIP